MVTSQHLTNTYALITVSSKQWKETRLHSVLLLTLYGKY